MFVLYFISMQVLYLNKFSRFRPIAIKDIRNNFLTINKSLQNPHIAFKLVVSTRIKTQHKLIDISTVIIQKINKSHVVILVVTIIGKNPITVVPIIVVP